MFFFPAQTVVDVHVKDFFLGLVESRFCKAFCLLTLVESFSLEAFFSPLASFWILAACVLHDCFKLCILFGIVSFPKLLLVVCLVFAMNHHESLR